MLCDRSLVTAWWAGTFILNLTLFYHIRSMYLHRSLFLFTLLLLNLGLVLGQSGVVYEDVPEGEHSVGAYDAINLLEMPGKSSRPIGQILFGEQVTHLGREAFVRGESPTYLLVRTQDGSTGWVNGSLLVQDGGVVVLLDRVPLYDKIGTPSSAKNAYLRAGELALLSDFREGWVYVTAKNKEAAGWVEGYDRLSAETADIEVASLIDRALALPDAESRRGELRKIQQSRSSLSQEMLYVLQETMEGTYGTPTYNPSRPNPASPRPQPRPGADIAWSGGEYFFIDDPDAWAPNPGTSTLPPVAPARDGYRRQVREVFNPETGEAYNLIIEEGTIQPVDKPKKAKDMYFAYHKSLPVGTSVLLEVPGTQQKYVQVTIVAKLRDNNPNMIGLGGDLIRQVLGEETAKSAGMVKILYPE